MSRNKGVGKVLFGIAVGIGLGFLFAPQKGSDTRKALKHKLDELLEKVKETDPKEVKETIVQKINEIKQELSDLDKEKAVAIVKKQAANIKQKSEDLYKYAVKKGTPMLEKAADEVRLQAAKVAREVADNLEKPRKKEKANKNKTI